MNHIKLIFLCAQWCDSCRAFKKTLQSHVAFHADFEYKWIDIEDDAGKFEIPDVDNFPTLLLARHNEPVFFSAVKPDIPTILNVVKSVTNHTGFSSGVTNENHDALKNIIAFSYSS